MVPAAILQKLTKEVHDAVNSQEYKDKLAALDIQPRQSSSQELANFLTADLGKWAKVVKDAGIKAE
jgi:tripartite-type tricarboxylate transporter receptor subunit TctC